MQDCQSARKTMTGSAFQVLLMAMLAFSLAGCESQVESQIRKTFKGQAERQAALLSSDKMHVVLLGTGGPISNETRDTSGTAIIAGGEFVLVDVGPGIVKNMNLAGLPAGKLSALLLTHYHSDHISDLGELNFMTWAQGRDHELDVYGPEGVEQVVEGFSMAYALDASYRTAHHGEEWMPPENSGMVPHTLTITEPEEAVLFFDRNGLRISVFQVDHSPVQPAVGYRIEYRGNVVVISGDTAKYSLLPRFAKDADLFLCEALNKDMVGMVSKVAGELGNERLHNQMRDVLDYHMSPVEAAEVAQEAGVKKLVLVHVVPPVENFIARRMYLAGTGDAFDGEIVLGKDGASFELDPK